MSDDNSSVRVAVRIRPQLAKEIIDACKTCVNKTPEEPQIWIGSNKAFTYDHVYDTECIQSEVYQDTVSDLIEGCFEGYNATVLAYGQTGSGKTYTMGTGFEVAASSEETIGIVPRAVKQLFEGINKRQNEARESGIPPPEFKVSAQFLELYNEDILDLFDNATCSVNKSSNGPIGGLGKRSTSASSGQSGIRIHEDANGNIYTVGVTSRTVHSEDETMGALKQGAFNRTTASTNMNDQSSRSHAIFTLYIQQQRQAKAENPFHLELEESEKSRNQDDLETLTAKFHFVDLAGSERLKRTGATGDRAKEGISINCGLLALGNVISALGDTTRKVSHVPYRDSKLTRLLQDSLGGNSRTLMIACVSPSDRDFMETLNTLKYANRARNIKNRITANQDKTSRTIMLLRQEIANLQFELMEYRQGKRLIGADGTETTNDMYHENTMLAKENSNLRTRIKAMQETIDVLTAKNSQLLADKEMGAYINQSGSTDNDFSAMVTKYISEIEELRAKLLESENLCEQLRKDSVRLKRLSQISEKSPLKPNNWSVDPSLDDSIHNTSTGSSNVQELIKMAKKDLEKNKEERKRKSSKTKKDEDKDEDSADDEESEYSEESDNDQDESSEDEDSDEDQSETINEELVELTSEISLKQKLIEELETSQKRLHIMKQQYETKLLALEQRILATQEERDKVLKAMEGKPGMAGNSEKMTKIKSEYQDKLGKLQGEVKKLKTAQKEHAKLLRNQAQYEKQVEKLKSEVLEMKRNKVRLVQKMKEESTRHRQMENQRNREMSTLKKLGRKHESKIKSLEAEKRMKEIALKRKNEEVSILRRAQRKISQGLKTPNGKGGKASINAKMAKSRWQNIEAKITKVALQKQAVSQMENDMDRWLKEREKLSHKLEKMRLKRRRLHAEKGQASRKLVEDMDDQIENLTSNVNYLQENIVECQQNIMQMENAEEMEQTETGTPHDLNLEEIMLNMADIRLPEAKYLLEKLLSMAFNQSYLALQKEGAIKELENRMNQAAKQTTLHQQLLQHMIEQQDLEIYDLMLANENGDEDSDSDSNEDLSSASLVNIEITNSRLTNIDSNADSDSSFGRREKARRKMTTKEDLLYNDMLGGSDFETVQPASLPPVLPKNFQRSQSFVKPSAQDLMVRSRSFVKPNNNNNNFRNSLRRYNNNSTKDTSEDIMSQSYHGLAPVYQPSPLLMRKPLQSPRSPLRRFNSAAKLSETENVTPPGSPPSFRRSGSRDETGKNVFHRLVAGTTIGESDLPSKGVIHPYQGRIAPKSPLICSNVAEGHTKAVLSVFATDELLFSASKDRTVKVWDLCRKEEINSLEGHPNNVVCVKYSEATRMAFTVSSAFIKVWDLRMSKSACIKTLSSSGLTTNGPVQLVSANRTLAMPTGETAVTDIALSPSGLSLFSAAADKVRVWDLRKFHSIGKLSGGHQAAVMCLATGGNYVITGSKDHTIKVFNVTDGKGGVVAPSASLEPPHYDGIESLALQGDTLFSASRDTCIKKWNLRNGEVIRSLNNAHKDWICGLCYLPGGQTIISGCRAGYIKLWSVESCALQGEMKAHNSTINTITTNNNHVFTGSNDGSIGMWRVRNHFDKSPDSEMSSSS